VTNEQQKARILHNMGLAKSPITPEKSAALRQIGVVVTPKVIALAASLKDDQEETSDKR